MSPPSSKSAHTLASQPSLADHPSQETLPPLSTSQPSSTVDSVPLSPPRGRTTSSRPSSRPPSPIRSLSQASSTFRTLATATTNVNAVGNSFPTSESNHHNASGIAQVEKSLRAHQQDQRESDMRSQHQSSKSVGSLSVANQNMLAVATPSPSPAPGRSPRRHDTITSSIQGKVSKDTRQAAETCLAKTSSEKPSDPSRNSSKSPTSNKEKEKQSEKQRNKDAQALAAEKHAWELTRGAGSAVLDLLRSTAALNYVHQNGGGQNEQQDSDGSRSDRPGALKVSSASTASCTSPKSLTRQHRPGSVWEAWQVLPTLDEVQARKFEPTIASSADKLLSRGISEYTMLPKILGRGKFSSVYLASKPSGPTGAPQLFAIKHTPLFPHHPLIATRLLREPTLLAELPPHPNLVTVTETIRTPGHFYLVEEYLGGYVTLEALIPLKSQQPSPHTPVLPTDVANLILDQLLSAVHAIHYPLQICHRDIKPENILVHPETLQLKLLDFGLATHFSKNEPKLTTCCGSPAFHCPEIVTALRGPTGSVRYWGPEVDAWTCGITMLRVLIGVRYPIGASHTSVRSMAIRAQRTVATIKDPQLRERVGKLLDVNGERRMRNFDELFKAIENDPVESSRGSKDFKSTTFIPTTPQHKMNLPLLVGPAAEAALRATVLPSVVSPSVSRRSTPASSRAASPVPNGFTPLSDAHVHEPRGSPAPSLILGNPALYPPPRALSFIKYCLRCAGIMYHCWPETSAWPGSPSGFFHEGHFNTGFPASTSLANMSTESLHSGDLSPITPLPIQAERPEKDPYFHIHIFECVLEVVDDEPEDTVGPVSFVQSIINALTFSRRPQAAARRSLSTPLKPNEAIRNTSRERSTKRASTSDDIVSNKQLDKVHYLTFYLVVRIPRRTSIATRPPYSRSSSRTRRLQPQSRASSVAATDREIRRELYRDASTESLTRLASVASTTAECSGMNSNAARRTADVDSNSTTPRPSRNASPSVGLSTTNGKKEGRLGPTSDRMPATMHRVGTNDKVTHAEGNVDLRIETSPELLKCIDGESSTQSGSKLPSTAQTHKTSRVRTSSTTGSNRRPWSNKVLVHVTDPRALDAVRKALSFGGTTADLNLENETDVDEASWSSPAWRTKELCVEEDQEPDTPKRSDQKLRKLTTKLRVQHSGQGESRSASRSDQDGSSAEDAGKQHKPDTSEQQLDASARFPTSNLNGSDDPQSYARGRRPGVAGAGLTPSGSPSYPKGTIGIPFPRSSRKQLPPSQLSTVALTAESPSSDIFPAKHGLALSPTLVREVAKETSDVKGLPVDFDLSKSIHATAALIAEVIDDRSPLSPTWISGLERQLKMMELYLQSPLPTQRGKVEDELDALSFDVFKALAPLLGLVDNDGAPTKALQMAKSILNLLCEFASPRELYMAMDLRCRELLDKLEAHQRPKDIQPSSLPSIWEAAEILGLLGLLRTVVPRIKTKKPQSFSSIFTLFPRCVSLSLYFASRKSASVCQSMSTQIAFAICELISAVSEWEADSNNRTAETETTKTLSQESLAQYLTGITNCIPYFGVSQSLSEAHFKQSLPKYNFQKPGQAPLPSGQDLTHTKDVTNIWAEIAKTLCSLEVDLSALWIKSLQGMSNSASSADASDTVSPVQKTLLSTLAVRGFVVYVNLLAQGFGGDDPATNWKGLEAQQKLETALPMIVLAMNSEMKRASIEQAAAVATDQETATEVREDALSDASLVWMLWCFDGLTQGEDRLPDELVFSLVEVLSSHAAISPSPCGRHVRFKLLERLLIGHCSSTVAITALTDLFTESRFIQIQACAITIARSLIVTTDVSMETLDSFLSVIFSCRLEIPKPDSFSLNSEAIERLPIWQEAAGLAYLVLFRLAKDSIWQDTIRTQLIDPLDKLLHSSCSSSSSSQLSGLDFLSVALDRIHQFSRDPTSLQS